MSREPWDRRETDSELRCHIAQAQIKDPKYLAAAYARRVLEEAVEFKRRALAGAIELGQFKFTSFIADQIVILDEALEIEP